MSARPVMTCESCRDLLIELVCEELPADTAAEVRAHALTCERCGPELAKLEGTLKVASNLPLLAPSPEVERRIMQAARAAVAGKAKGLAREQQLAEGRVASWFVRVSAWAMSPQVAMASVLILVVGIGLYALPIGRSPETTALRATEEEEATPQSAEPEEPAAAAAATPLPTPERQAAERRAPADLGEAAAQRSEEALKRRSAQRAAKPKAASAKGAASYDALGNVVEARPRARERSADGDYASADDKAQPRAKEEAKQASEAAGSSAGRGGFAPPPPAARAPASASAPVGAPKQAQASPGAPAPEASARISKEPVTQLLGALAQGIAAAQRGDYTQAEKLLTPVAEGGAGAERIQATLWLARSLRAQGDCARALTYYRSLTQAVSAGRDVLEEAADCYDRTGNEAQATKLRARAQTRAQKAR